MWQSSRVVLLLPLPYPSTDRCLYSSVILSVASSLASVAFMFTYHMIIALRVRLTDVVADIKIAYNNSMYGIVYILTYTFTISSQKGAFLTHLPAGQMKVKEWELNLNLPCSFLKGKGYSPVLTGSFVVLLQRNPNSRLHSLHHTFYFSSFISIVSFFAWGSWRRRYTSLVKFC